MFGSDDDIDFMPGSGSKLASLFGGAKSEGDNASFTFAAPKQPKKGILKEDQKSKTDVTIKQGVAPTEGEAEKLSIIVVRAVHVFLLVDGQYSPQGKLGVAVLGNASRNIYQLLLYKGRQQHVTSTKITPTFSFSIQANNYGSFYNDQGQNWSIHFESSTDCEEFARQVALARAASQGGVDKVLHLLTQDLSVPNESESDSITANEGDTVEVFYSVNKYAAGKLGMVVESNLDAKKPQKVKVQKNVWEEGLIGISKGVKRILLLPPDIVGPWKKSVPDGTSLVVEVVAGRMKQARSSSPRLPSVADSGESALESSADDSIRARGATISQALAGSPRANKASLISRMARMGQATLPLRGAISCNPSDSEETGDESSSRSAKATNFKPVKGRVVKARPAVPHQTAATDAKSPSNPQQVVVYQSVPVPWQQQPVMEGYNMARAYQGQDGRTYTVPPTSSNSLPVFPSTSANETIGSPSTSSELSVFLSETRTHNTEVRMAVSKVGDKIDQVLGKLDAQCRGSSTLALMDSNTLMSTIQRMITENEQLKLELEDKRGKVEAQNEKIYQLLNSKQQYMEQSSNASGQEAALHAENAKLTAELLSFKEKANTMLLKQEKNQGSWEKQVLDLHDIIKKLQVDLEAKNHSTVEIDEKTKEIARLRESLAEMQSSKEEATTKLATVKEELEVTKNESARQLASVTEKYTSRISALESQGNALKKQLEMLVAKSPALSESQTADKVRSVMNAVWKALQTQFSYGETYEGDAIRQTLMATIREVTIQHVNVNAGSPARSVKPADAAKGTNVAVAASEFTNSSPPGANVASTHPRTRSPILKEAMSTSVQKTPAARAVTIRTPSPPPKVDPPRTTDAAPVNVDPPRSTDASPAKVDPPKTTDAAPVNVDPPRSTDAAPAKVDPPRTTDAIPAKVDPPRTTKASPAKVLAKPVETRKPKPAERKIPAPEVTSNANHTVEAPVSHAMKEEVDKRVDVHETQGVASRSMSPPPNETSPRQTPEPSTKQRTREAKKADESVLVAGGMKPGIEVDAKPVAVAKQVAEVKKVDTATKTDDQEAWRPEPPPLFDTDDDDDAWLASS